MSALQQQQQQQQQLTVPSSTIISSAWDVALSNAIVKTGLGFGGAFPVWLGVGFGLGRSYAEADSVFREAGIRRIDA
ncbi:hypothetical protein CAS74_002034 [Pichia kudriavzevii]|uniref:MICOS complex subunit MIC10 n=1 Tax=Pichia kudriavzevii TaxID=4909 RepID=A0A099NYN8_PICKU|nr:hypothetical protein JL09_g3100 [Pichia kudriavzevii]OUT22318.1 hypothetical protein CAS74_002034 [Pichia kudriavzevii]